MRRGCRKQTSLHRARSNAFLCYKSASHDIWDRADKPGCPRGNMEGPNFEAGDRRSVPRPLLGHGVRVCVGGVVGNTRLQ